MNGQTHMLALIICAAVICLTVYVSLLAHRRSQSDTGFFAAGRQIKSWQNGLAIAGEFISAGSFLGTTGLIFYNGIDGSIILVASVVSFVPILLYLAERMRNVGHYTLADVLTYRTQSRYTRLAAALSTVTIGLFVLMPQMVGAGVLLNAISGVPFTFSVIATGVLMAIYVYLGGMLATTWVQVIKCIILVVMAGIVALGILAHFGFSLPRLFQSAVQTSPVGQGLVQPGVLFRKTGQWDLLSYALTFALGTAGMAHILIRFFTVPDAATARRSVGWTVAVMAFFYLIVILMGFGAIAILGVDGPRLVGAGGNLTAPVLVTQLGGGPNSFGGALALACVAAVAFVSIVAVVAGVVISAAGSIAHDIWPVLSRGRGAVAEATVARLSAIAISFVAIVATVLIGESKNITLLMGLAFMIAASANLPCLLFALFWRGFNARGAVAGIMTGLISTLLLLPLTPALWMGGGVAPLPISLPVIFTLPLAVAACVVGSLSVKKSRREAQAERFAEFFVRSSTGIGAQSGAGSVH